MTIPTERVRQYATDEFMFAADDVRAMAAELLAVRETQSVPVEKSVPVKWEYIKGIEQYFIGAPEWATHYLAFDTGLHRSWADGKHPGARLKSCNGGDESVMCHPFLWGVMGERRITAPLAPAVPGELLDAMAEVIRISYRDHEAWDRAKAAISSCRAAMLNHSGDSNEKVPAGFKLVPAELTTENGAKASLIGEFTEVKFINCPECFGDAECESCDGSGRIRVEAPVSWTTIKAIWKKGIEHFDSMAAAPTPTK